MAVLAAVASRSPHGDGLGGSKAYARRRPEEIVLYRVVQAELETFLARAQARERPVPRFVERELRGFLRCGILARGFVRVHCDECGLDRVVAFSCKGRGLCPSCGGRRMADTAAHLVDRVLPEVPVRQWVLSLPFGLRYRLAYDAPLTSAIPYADRHPRRWFRSRRSVSVDAEAIRVVPETEDRSPYEAAVLGQFVSLAVTLPEPFSSAPRDTPLWTPRSRREGRR